MTSTVLQIESLRRTFDGLVAVDNVDLEIPSNEIHGVIGPNGAGKSTTFFNLISGALEPSSGQVRFEGRNISSLPAHRRAKLGVVQVFQITSVFPELTVAENVLGASNAKRRFLNPFRRIAPRKDGTVVEILDRVNMTDRADEKAKTLSHGEQRVLEIGMVLATDPSLLLFDEPTAGLSSKETAEIKSLIRGLSGELTIMLIEHDMDIIMDLVDRITVLHNGSLLAQGTPDFIGQNREVQNVYLGRDH